MSATTLRSLKAKAKKLSNFVPYLIEVSKEPNKDVCWLTKNYGMQGSDVAFVGSASECESYLLGMEEMLAALS